MIDNYGMKIVLGAMINGNENNSKSWLANTLFNGVIFIFFIHVKTLSLYVIKIAQCELLLADFL